jgi:hypothetical protein
LASFHSSPVSATFLGQLFCMLASLTFHAEILICTWFAWLFGCRCLFDASIEVFSVFAFAFLMYLVDIWLVEPLVAKKSVPFCCP